MALAVAALSTAALRAVEMDRPKPQPSPRVKLLSQNCIQRGNATEIVVSGDSLDQASSALLVPSDGIDTKLVRDGKTLKVRLTAAGDASLEERELRFQTPSGVSNPVSIAVTPFPVASEKEHNNALLAAQSIELPATVSGVVQNPGDTDYYRFAAKKGEAYVFDVVASRAGSKLDSALTIFDEKGNELAHNEDAIDVDSILTFNAPADGNFIVLVRDTRYQGGGDFTYRMNAGPLPYIESIFPLGGQRGQKIDIALLGRNLGDNAKQTVSLAAEDKLGTRELRSQSPLGPSNTYKFVVGEFAEALEREPNDAREQAASLAVPVTVNGRIDKAGDVDLLRFKADKDGPLTIEVYATAGGSELDALLMLQNADGGVIAQNDDLPQESRGNIDARIDFKDAKKDKEYIVALRDLHDRGGSNFAYRVTVRPPAAPSPDFAVRFSPDTIDICRGSNTKVWAEVSRLGGFDGDVTLNLQGLPPGVVCEAVIFPNNPPTSGLFILSATAEAQIGSFPIVLTASGAIKGQPATRSAVAELNGDTVRQAYLTVLNKPPFTVELPRVEAAQMIEKSKAEIAELEKTLNVQTPEVLARMAEWEKKDAVGASWVVMEPQKLISAAYAKTEKQPDGAILVSGGNPVKDTYKLIVQTALRGITAFQLEALPHSSLGASGPGRAENGNFVLTHFKVDAAANADANNIKPVVFSKATADFSQDGFGVENALLNDPNKGWAISPQFGKAHSAIFECKDPIDYEGGTTLTITLDQASPHAKHTLGHFRVSATTLKNPASGKILPANVRVALDTPADKRTDQHKKDMFEFYRTQDPEMAKIRNRIQELKATQEAKFPPQLKRNSATDMPIVIRREPGFTGDITINVEGFSSGRDPKTKQPKALSENIESKPVILKGLETLATINLKAKDKAEEGTRTILVRAEAVHEGRMYREYSPPIPLTVGAASAAGKGLNKEALKPDAITELVAGLNVNYYEGEWSTLPDFSKLQPKKTSIAAKVDLTPAARPENYALKFEGRIDITRDGVYTFYTNSDDGSRLFISGREVVSNDGAHAAQEESGQVLLKRGAHKIVIEYFQGGGGGALEASYEGPEVKKQAIPANVLFHEKK